MFGETAQPVEGVALAEVVRGGVEVVVGEIALRPVEVLLRNCFWDEGR